MKEISTLFLIAEIHSTTNLKSYEQAKKLFNLPNRQSSSEVYLKEKTLYVYWYVFPFHLIQYTNTEFMSMITLVHSQSSQISKMEHFAEIVND